MSFLFLKTTSSLALNNIKNNVFILYSYKEEVFISNTVLEFKLVLFL